MKPKFLLFLSVLFLASASYGQLLVFDFDDGDSFSNDIPGSLNGSLDSGLENLSNWSMTDPTPTSYKGESGEAIGSNIGDNTFTFSFDIKSGQTLDITGFSFWHQKSDTASGTGPSSFVLKINGNTLGTGSVPSSGSLNNGSSITGFDSLTGTINVSLIYTGATSGSGTIRVDNFSLLGSTNPVSAIPEPSTYAALLGGLAFCCIYYRRRKQQKT